MPNISFHQSVTGFSAEKITQATNYLNNKMAVQNEDSKAKAAIKYLGQGAVGFVGSLTQLALGVLAIVETVARHTFAIIAKVLTFLLPTGKLDEKVSALFNHAKLASETVAKSFTKTFTFSKVEAKCVNFDKAYNSRVMEFIKNIHINGDTRKVETPTTDVVSSPTDVVTSPATAGPVHNIDEREPVVVAHVNGEASDVAQTEETTETSATTTEETKAPSLKDRYCTERNAKRLAIVLTGLGFATAFGIAGYKGAFSGVGSMTKNAFDAGFNTTKSAFDAGFNAAKSALNATRGYFASKLHG